MQKKNLVYYSLIALLFFSCKKKDTVDDSPSGTPIANVLPSDSSSYDALFSCLDLYSKISGSYTPNGNQTSAYYSSQIIIKEVYAASNLQNMGPVILNTVGFKNKSIVTNYYYSDSTLTHFSLPHAWNIGGTSAIATFSYVNTNSPPTFTASANIPDSITISSGFSIPIKGTTDCSLIRVFINGGVGSTVYPNKLFSGTDTIISFTSSELQGLTPTNTGYLSVQLFRDHYRSIAGKRVNFRSGLNYSNIFFKIKP
jgi:hypothetical protein